jgi:thiol-disulfide isomerase/thioredoxin
MIRYIKSNIGTILFFIFLALVAFNPKVKGLILRQLIRTGLYEPNVEHLRPDPAAVVDVPAPKRAPSAIFRTANGDMVDISKSRGKVIFLNFWATWCPPCLAEMPSINFLRAKLKDNKDILFIMADVDSNLGLSGNFMKRNKYELPVYEPMGSIPETIFQGTVPTTLIINKQGEIVFSHEGMADYGSDKMEAFLRSLTR